MSSFHLMALPACRSSSILAMMGVMRVLEHKGLSPRAWWVDTSDASAEVPYPALEVTEDISDLRFGQLIHDGILTLGIFDVLGLTLSDLSQKLGVDHSELLASKNVKKKKKKSDEKKYMAARWWKDTIEAVRSTYGDVGAQVLQAMWTDTSRERGESKKGKSGKKRKNSNARHVTAVTGSPRARCTRASTLEGYLSKMMSWFKRIKAEDVVERLLKPLPNYFREDDAGLTFDYESDPTFLELKTVEGAYSYPLNELLAMIGDTQLVIFPSHTREAKFGTSGDRTVLPVWSNPRSLRSVVSLLARSIPKDSVERNSLGIFGVYESRRETINKASCWSMTNSI